MNVIFFGTPSFAVEPLKKLHNSNHKILAVVTQPDRAKNRKGEFIFSPVKSTALSLNLNVLQFNSVKKEGIETLKNLNADIFVTAGYGQLFSQEIIDIPPKGIINIHASLLPFYRGSSPIQWAIMNGETRTGVTIMQTDLGLDTGDILHVRNCEILPTDTTATLTDRLSVIGAEALIEALDKIQAGQIVPIKQNHEIATKFPLITKDTGRLDFSLSATKLANMVRAIDCHTYIEGKYVKILGASVSDCVTDCEDDTDDAKAGEIVGLNNVISIKCGEGILNIHTLQPENKKPMTAKEFLLGRKLPLGLIIGLV